MAGKGDTPRPVDQKKYAKGLQQAFGHWACNKCWKTNNRKESKQCTNCGAKRSGSSYA